ncbi:hypothetical protein KAR10_01285 [bacterium]|nr:hypothetical protein [bacterium]
MSWTTEGGRIKEVKFLVDLAKHTYISEKSHQEIIDRAGLNPAGFDNYLKGWVKSDGTIKIWVENIEDIVFRYWDQIKLGFNLLIKEKLTRKKSRLYAIVNRVERYAGVIQDFMLNRSKQSYFDKKIGFAVHFYGQPKVTKGRPVIMLVNYKLTGNHYIFAGTKGRVLVSAASQAKRIRVKWLGSSTGYMKTRGGVELLTDRRLLSLI